MKKLKSLIEKNQLDSFKEECEKIYLYDKDIIKILKILVKDHKLNFFDFMMKRYLSPEIFMSMNDYLVKNNQYDFLKLMIVIARESETEEKNKNDYADQLLFNFIEKDDLFFVSYLVENEKVSTKSVKENELTVLSECAINNAIKCFDYFVSNGKDIHEFNDLALFEALKNKNNKIVHMIIEIDEKINEDLEKNFFKYGELNKKELLNIVNVIQSTINKNVKLQNSLNARLLELNMFKELEKNLLNGSSPNGDEDNDLMFVACQRDFEINNVRKGVKLLLDFGADLKEEYLNLIDNNELRLELSNYPRFSKIKSRLEKSLPSKKKSVLKKI